MPPRLPSSADSGTEGVEDGAVGCLETEKLAFSKPSMADELIASPLRRSPCISFCLFTEPFLWQTRLDHSKDHPCARFISGSAYLYELELARRLKIVSQVLPGCRSPRRIPTRRHRLDKEDGLSIEQVCVERFSFREKL